MGFPRRCHFHLIFKQFARAPFPRLSFLNSYSLGDGRRTGRKGKGRFFGFILSRRLGFRGFGDGSGSGRRTFGCSFSGVKREFFSMFCFCFGVGGAVVSTRSNVRVEYGARDKET